MRKTGPVTQREYVLEDGATLVSTTDYSPVIGYRAEFQALVPGLQDPTTGKCD